MNYYELLEVSPNASAAVIRAAYKSLIQRYHPDKNPGDAAIAERASLVVQAYEILSDSEKRSAYDLELKRQSAVRGTASRRSARRDKPSFQAAGTAPKGGRYFWFMCVIVAVIVVSAWSMTSLLKKRLLLEQQAKPQNTIQIVRKPAETVVEDTAKTTPEKARPIEANAIPSLVTGLAVNLKNPDKPTEDSGQVLTIPVLGVKVGPRDPESALKHLKNTAELIKQKLQDDLAKARYEELAKADGEAYLARMILEAIGDATGTAKPPGSAPASEAEAAERYGVVEVLLPESFSVK